MTDAVLKERLKLADDGTKTFPATYGGKAPLRGVRWKQEATADREVIQAQHAGGARLNYGIPAGANGFCVIDLDCKGGKDGIAEFAAWQRDLGVELGETWKAKTPNNGLHLFVARPPGGLGNPVGLRPGIDVRCDAGYVIGAKSFLKDAGHYDWVAGCSPDDLSLAQCPAPLAAAIRAETKASTNTSAHTGGGIAEGTRNRTLFRRACLLRGRGATLEDIIADLGVLAQQCSPPLPNDELLRIAESAMRYDPNPSLSELDLARRLIAQDGEDLRYCHPRSEWYVFSQASGWRPDTDGEVTRRTKNIVDAEVSEKAALEDANARKGLVQAQSRKRIVNAIALATTEPGVPIAANAFDRDPLLLHVANGVVDLTTGQLRERRREDYMTRICNASYDPDAKCEMFMNFVELIFANNGELIDFAQLTAGYAATGLISEQCMFLLTGGGKNGKSVFANTLRGVLGTYAMHTPTETLIAKPGGRNNSNDLARLNGARLVTAIESNKGGVLDTALVKQITGGEPITARKLFKEFEEFIPSLTLLLATNHPPQIDGGDEAIWRRIYQIPFNVIIPPERMVRDYENILLQERDGILRWIVEGAVKWRRTGLIVPKCVSDATGAYRRELDHVGTFLDEKCERTPSARVGSSEFLAAYNMWAAAEDRPAMNQQQFGHELGRRGIGKTNVGGKVFRTGIRMQTQLGKAA